MMGMLVLYVLQLNFYFGMEMVLQLWYIPSLDLISGLPNSHFHG